MKIHVGEVVQINENIGLYRAGWMGAFLLVEEVYSWGVQGFVHVINTHEESSRAYIRLTNEQFDLIGKAVLVPKNIN